jgi:agmatine/peptidylarginine deiminase
VAAGSSSGILSLPNGKNIDLDEQQISFYMPAEWAEHQGCWIAWPKRCDLWRAAAEPAKKAFKDVIMAVSRFEPVTVIAHKDQVSWRTYLLYIYIAVYCCVCVHACSDS